MIRPAIALRWALVGSSIVPSLCLGQDSNKPADPISSTAPEAGEKKPTVRTFRTVRIEGDGLRAPGQSSQSYLTVTQPDARWSQAFVDPLQLTFGLQLAAVDDALRSQLDIPPGQGVVVVGVKPGGLAEQAGLKSNDVLLSLGEQKVMGVNPARAMLLSLGKEASEVKLIREGKPRRMSLVGPEHGFPPEAAEFWIGVPVSPVDATLRSHLTALPNDAGLVANDVVAESPASRAGLKKNDILVKLGDKPLKTSDSLIEQVQASGGKPLPLEILRAGHSMTLTVTPARRAHPTTINLPNHPNIQYRWVRPNIAVEENNKAFFQAQNGLETLFKSPMPNKPGDKPIDIQLELLTPRAKSGADDVSARIEAQLKELSAKLEEVRKAVDGLKRAEAK